MTDFATLSPRNRTIVEALLNARDTHDGGQLTLEALRRKLKTTKANVIEALTELEGTYPEVAFDSDAQVAMWDSEESDSDDIAGGDADEDDDELTDRDSDPEPASPADMGEVMVVTLADFEAETAEDEPAPPAFRFPDKHRALYAERGGNCGDQLAEALTNYLNHTHAVPRKDGKGNRTVKGIDLHALWEVAEANGITTVRGNNPGQMRMNLSNMLRAKWRRGTDITVGETVIPGIPQPEAKPQPTAKLVRAEDRPMFGAEHDEHSAGLQD